MKALKKLKTKDKTIRNLVIADCLEYKQDAIEHLKDVAYHGCQSGVVSNLIYYTDTNKFYNKYQDEIHELIASSIDEGLLDDRTLSKAFTDNNFTNWATWFAYEVNAQNILNELEA